MVREFFRLIEDNVVFCFQVVFVEIFVWIFEFLCDNVFMDFVWGFFKLDVGFSNFVESCKVEWDKEDVFKGEVEFYKNNCFGYVDVVVIGKILVFVFKSFVFVYKLV